MNLRIQQLIEAGESRTVEFKTARSALNDDLFETVCAFLNRDGGDILLGVRNLFRYCKAYAGHDPELMENDVFRFELTLKDASGTSSGTTSESGSGTGSETVSEKTSEKTSEKILKLADANPEITIAELAEKTGVTTRSIERNLRKLQSVGSLRRIGPDKGGRWEVKK